MKLTCTVLALAAAAAALPQHHPGHAQAQPQAREYDRRAQNLAYDAQLNPDSFKYHFETDNGIKQDSQGQENEGISSQGGYQYTGDDGQQYQVQYLAGPDGFRAQGAHIPTPPPVPEEIQKALEQNARDEAAGILDDGKYDAAKYGEGAPAQQPQRRAQQYNQQYNNQQYNNQQYNNQQNKQQQYNQNKY